MISGAKTDIPKDHAILFMQPEDKLRIGYPTKGPKQLELVYISIEAGETVSIFRELLQRRGRVVKISPRSPAVMVLRRLLPRYGQVIQRLDADAGARHVFELLATLLPPPNLRPHLDKVEQAMDHMLTHLEHASLEETAETLGISRMHLHRMFLDSLQTPPSKWLRKQRLAKAEALLVDSSKSVASIAQTCGFSGSTAFIASFRREKGMPPTQWRKIHQIEAR